jgi:hypothetical protein
MFSDQKLLSELLLNRLPTAATTTKEGRNELENWWARLGSNQRPADYEFPTGARLILAEHSGRGGLIDPRNDAKRKQPGSANPPA